MNEMQTLFNLLEQRKVKKIDGSYTNYLFDEGIDKIGKKIGEEAMELVMAAKNNDTDEIVNEAVDLMYHMFVLLVEQGISYEQIITELVMRQQKMQNLKSFNEKGEL